MPFQVPNLRFTFPRSPVILPQIFNFPNFINYDVWHIKTNDIIMGNMMVGSSDLGGWPRRSWCNIKVWHMTHQIQWYQHGKHDGGVVWPRRLDSIYPSPTWLLDSRLYLLRVCLTVFSVFSSHRAWSTWIWDVHLWLMFFGEELHPLFLQLLGGTYAHFFNF